MDYQALAYQIPFSPSLWSPQQVQKWLQFVHLPGLSPAFASHHINGTMLLSLNNDHLQLMGISNNIIKKKLLRWIKEGFNEYQQYLCTMPFDNKENIPPLQRKVTTERGCIKPQKAHNWCFENAESELMIRSCDGNLAAFYIMKEKVLKIGRSPINTIRSLEVSVQNEHAEVMKNNGRYYLLDKGTEAGTFIKICQPRVLNVGTLIEMGSFLMQVKIIDKELKTIVLEVNHMISGLKCEIVITLNDGCNSYSFGRRKSNNFFSDDEHLSGIHSKIFLQQGEFAIEDLHSTNGTWLRLSFPHSPSEAHLLQQGTIFKIGTTITYQCQAPQIKEQKMEIQYSDGCLSCQKQKKNILLLPCRHNAVCSLCSENMESCPLCGGNISQRIKIYI